MFVTQFEQRLDPKDLEVVHFYVLPTRGSRKKQREHAVGGGAFGACILGWIQAALP